MARSANAVIGQSGGPTSVINASLAGVVRGCLGRAEIEKVYGMRWGIEGFMGENLVDLGAEDPDIIERLKQTPSSALGSSRHKLKEADLGRIMEVIEAYGIRYFFLIGGNDTMDTINRVEAYCRDKGREVLGVGIPKTVDNDLFGTDHTPGYGSAARYVALSVKQAGLLARDMQKVDRYVIYQTVGRDAGWLPAASAAARESEGDAPHIILLPERPFDREGFLSEVEACHDRHGWVSVVCGEGIAYADGTPVSASTTADSFANVEFGAMGGTSRHDAPSHDRRRVRVEGRVPGLRVASDVRRRPAEPHGCGGGLRVRGARGRAGGPGHVGRYGEHREGLGRSIRMVPGNGAAP